jgi:tetratricopeptide (TPR) repeat protein
MRFNKAKAVRAAEKSLSQGKIQAAITEYRYIVEQDASDWTALNMLGDLYVRQGQPDDANGLFTRVAEHYRSQGFALKAIAMYKKMLRLRPEDLTASVTLAELYAAQGLIVEARAQLLSIADTHTRAGRTHDALDTLRRIADLDPHNPEVRLRVATAFARENFADEATEAYAEAGDRFLARRAPEQALEAYAEALALRPLCAAALAGTLAAHTQLDTPDEAAELFESLCAGDTCNAEILELLLRAYLEADNPASAEETIERLIALKPNDGDCHLQFVEVARLHLKLSETDAAVNSLTRALEFALAANREAELLEILDEVTTRDPEHFAALRLLTRVYTWQRDEASLIATLERIADSALASENTSEETQALLLLLELAPDEKRYRERLSNLGALPAHPVSGFIAKSNSHEVPTFESFMMSDNTAAFADNLASANIAPDDSLYANTATAEFDFESLSPIAAIEDQSTVFDTSASFADLNDDIADGNFASEANHRHANASDVDTANYQEVTWGAPLDTDAIPLDAFEDIAPAVPASATDARIAALLAHELESVDFYIAQGYADVAGDTLDMLERQYGAHAEITNRRQRLTPTDATEAVDTEIPDHQVFDYSEQVLASDVSSESSFGELSFGEMSLDDAGFNAATTPEVAAPDAGYMDFALDAPTVEIHAELNAASVVETNDLSTADVVTTSVTNEKAATDFTAAREPVVNEFDHGLSALFDEFRDAVETDSPVNVGDYETHYNLGIAYQEMGLLDESIEEFQKAAGIAAPADGTPRYLQCCNMLGHCFMQKDLPQLAVMWLRKGLDAPGHTEDEYQALRFELAAAYDAAGEQERALTTFMEVYGVDVSYRGVADRVRELRTRTSVLS